MWSHSPQPPTENAAPQFSSPDSALADQLYFDSSEFAERLEFEEQHYWHRHRRAFLLAVMVGHGVQRRSRMLEIGCGIGTVTTFLNAAGFTVDYADVHPKALELAQRKATQQLGAEGVANRRFLQLDLNRANPPAGYDGFLLFDVLEHLPDDATALQRLVGALPPGGFVFISVPAYEWLWSSWDEQERHKRRYSRKMVRALLGAAGLQVGACGYFFSLLVPVVWLAKQLAGRRAPASGSGVRHRRETYSAPWINKALVFALAWERAFAKRRGLPFGTSVYGLGWRRPSRGARATRNES